jgi:carboxyl-terminal processing protease
MVEFADGLTIVNDLVPGGPAAQDGRIQKGDALVGVVDDKTGVLGFADKTPEQRTALLRGPVGSKIKVLVRAKGGDDFKVIEIERAKLDVSKTENVDAVKDEKSEPKPEAKSNSTLPPTID